MKWWNLFGLNPEFKQFLDKHPDKTMIGLAWSMYWRFGIIILALELVLFLVIALFVH